MMRFTELHSITILHYLLWMQAIRLDPVPRYMGWEWLETSSGLASDQLSHGTMERGLLSGGILSMRHGKTI